ncbi:ABC transporter substrate-binding protein [Bosea sp. BK604]|uniref:ABC transporter substrate-binding protein n=1 Tax=Bosea sp. BK604 TaxID=2512180 RepID=UPI001050FC14|nr:ABC transporter substrate-binding protein [Bosea sp. BK604]TCR61781.1 peptide/nickel transport system substrate-binding protein [Bosea sp. BK604]
MGKHWKWPVRAVIAAVLALSAAGAQAGKDRFTVDLSGEPSSLDPHLQWNPDSYYVYRNIFDNLVTRDDKGQIVPQIATAWRQLSDTQIEFTIRDDVSFHDGSKLTPQDVVFSVKRITDKAFGSPQLGQFDKIADAAATGANTVTLTTSAPYPALLAQLVKLSIVPKAAVEALGNDGFNQKPIGSGPYRFDSWQRGVAVTLARNETYWGTKGQFPVVLFRAVPDGATRLANLQAGTADLAVGLDTDQAGQLKSSQRAKALTALTERVAYLRLNTTKPPFDIPKVRQAVAHAIDKEGLTDGILGGYDKPMPELLTPVVFGWADGIKALPYDPTRAKALIGEAGAAAKDEVELATAPVFDQRIVQAIQQQLTDVGLNVKIVVSDMASYLRRAQSGPDTIPTLSFGRWSCACQDADGVLFPLLHRSSGWSAYRNAEVDTLLETARQALDPAKRLASYAAVHEIVARDVPAVPLYQSSAIYGATRNLEWQPTPNESLFLNRMRWTD